MPFTVVTEADAGRLDKAGQAFIVHFGFIGTSRLTTDGATSTWTLEAHEPGPNENAPKPSDAIEWIGASMDALVVVIQHGQFDDALGFDVSDDGRAVKLQQTRLAESAGDSTKPFELQLRWRTTRVSQTRSLTCSV